ncbi:hypothetical protein FisN_4Hu045 [Fistulifera solaris]|uniref:Bifunctional dihydrofolate reductase-thymidylate synthase n=1 Tax=Fistulifera solaris TaxID=1519565 RepID=A0A1Z5KPZ7_FISSO|nr:hypothetical protein FisN_4Hu045 [Fistulifera solaris]|eukprot:GAX28383.1 hypothetical protein FisN_4Hu045 [Fistulifera solaris]
MSFISLRHTIFRSALEKKFWNQSRHFAVKELSWCAASESPNKKQRENARNNSDDETTNEERKLIDFRFGIVAAAARENNVIGFDGTLPWNLPEEREMFKALTRDKILLEIRCMWLIPSTWRCKWPILLPSH